jgi:hypothetical protein
MELVPAVAVDVPAAQVDVTPPGPTTKPAGKVSVKLKVCEALAADEAMVKRNVDVPPTVKPV